MGACQASDPGHLDSIRTIGRSTDSRGFEADAAYSASTPRSASGRCRATARKDLCATAAVLSCSVVQHAMKRSKHTPCCAMSPSCCTPAPRRRRSTSRGGGGGALTTSSGGGALPPSSRSSCTKLSGSASHCPPPLLLASVVTSPRLGMGSAGSP
eukprot:5230251-Prymnesium_polylepis.1